MKPINDKIFIDTNIVIYLYSQDEPHKSTAIKELFENCTELYISTQVLNEFIIVLSRKKNIEQKSLRKAVDELIQNFNLSIVTFETIKIALDISNQHKYSYFDCLIIASALENGCNVLYTEDMHETHIINKTLKVINPFKITQ